MKVYRKLEYYIRVFFTVFTCTTVAASVFTSIFTPHSINTAVLWEILLYSGLASAFSSIFHMDAVFGKWSLPAKVAFHFLLNAATLLSFAGVFRWIRFGSLVPLISMILLIFAGYFICFSVNYMNDLNQARLLNIKLNEYKRKRSNTNG